MDVYPTLLGSSICVKSHRKEKRMRTLSNPYIPNIWIKQKYDRETTVACDERRSRRTVLTRALGFSGAFGAWGMINSKRAAAASIDPSWQDMLNVAIANSRNQAALFKTGKGLLVSFGDNLFNFDLFTDTFELATEQATFLRGRSSVPGGEK